MNSRYLLSVLVDEPAKSCRPHLARLDRTMATMTESGLMHLPGYLARRADGQLTRRVEEIPQ
jgi:hypothetical protein